MQIEQKKWTKSSGWSDKTSQLTNQANLVFVFGGTDILKSGQLLTEVKNFYPHAIITGCSTAGEIYGSELNFESLSVTALYFEHTTIKSAGIKIKKREDSYLAGAQLAKKLYHNNLKHVLVLSDGMIADGGHLITGLIEHLPKNINVSGGLAGDYTRLQESLVIYNGQAENNYVTILGFYGGRININCGSAGGWKAFGPEKAITKVKNNILYELDGKPALDVYKLYLKDQAKNLPASAIMLPLSIKDNKDRDLIRGVIGINEAEKSLTCTSDISSSSHTRFMKARIDDLIDGALEAAKISHNNNKNNLSFSLLISCLGRQLVLKQRTEEEIEAVVNYFGENNFSAGFYSHGEISPFSNEDKSSFLHNYTMTITNFSEL